jgi:putative transposase
VTLLALLPTHEPVPQTTSALDPGHQQLRAFSRAHPRWGYRRAHAQLLHQGWVVNRKAIQRLWREEGLRVPAQRRKRQRLGTSTTPADRLAAEHPDHVWRWTTSSTRPRTAGG